MSAAESLAIIAVPKNISRFVLFFEPPGRNLNNLNKGLGIVTASHCVLWHPAAYYTASRRILMASHSISSYGCGGVAGGALGRTAPRPAPPPPCIHYDVRGLLLLLLLLLLRLASALIGSLARLYGHVGAGHGLLLRDSGIQKASVKIPTSS